MEDKIDSPVSVETIERITRTFERHHHSHSNSPVVSTLGLPRFPDGSPILPASPPLVRFDNSKVQDLTKGWKDVLNEEI